jgi:predicted Ser/Thr protein kinase
VKQPDADTFPVNFANEIGIQMKAAEIGVAPKIYAYDLNQGSLAMEYLNPKDYMNLRDFRFRSGAEACT